MIRARQELEDARHNEGTYCWLAAGLLQLHATDIPESNLGFLRRVCKQQLGGEGDEPAIKHQVAAIIKASPSISPEGYSVDIELESELSKVRVKGGTAFHDTPFMVRLRELRMPATHAGSPSHSTASSADRSSDGSATGPYRHRSSDSMALDDSDDPSLGFLPPAVCLLYEGGQEGVANGTVAIRPLPIKPGSTKSADEGSDDTASQRIHGTSTGDDCGSPPIHLTEEEQALAQSRMLDVCDQFRKGLAYAISYLVISMQMQSGWLGMFYLGTKFTRLAAISRDAIAIEFGELSPYFWDDPSWFPSLAADAHVASLAPPDTPSRSPAPSQLPTHEEFTSPTVVTVHEIFKLPNRLHERLAHELVVPSTVNEVLPQLDKDGIQTLLDFFAAAAFDRLHLPVPGANEAIDWDKLRNCPFHQQLLLLVSQVELQQDSCEQDTWPAGVTPEETPHDTGHTDNGNLDYNIHRVKSDWALQQTHTDKPRRNLEHICLGWLYEIADALEEEERMYECQLQIFQDIGLKLVVVSTAHMDQIIEEHISAMDNHS